MALHGWIASDMKSGAVSRLHLSVPPFSPLHGRMLRIPALPLPSFPLSKAQTRPSSLRFRSVVADGIIGLSSGAYGLQAHQKARGFRLLQIDLRQQDEDIPFIDRLPVVHGRKSGLDAVLGSPGCGHPQSFPQAFERALDFRKSHRLQGKASPCFSILSAFSSPEVCSAAIPCCCRSTASSLHTHPPWAYRDARLHPPFLRWRYGIADADSPSRLAPCPTPLPAMSGLDALCRRFLVSATARSRPDLPRLRLACSRPR